jgi:hypothetical protein
MGKYSDIVDGSWYSATIHPESIPHLFHEDLAYLWILEKAEAMRPEQWKDRIEAWKFLVGLLLTGSLEPREESIAEPFLSFTRGYGVTKVTWLQLRESSTTVGVLSPCVLARPLPDLQAEDLRGMRAAVSEAMRARLRYAAHFAELAANRLSAGGPEGSIRDRLARLLRKEFTGEKVARSPGGRSFNVTVLDELGWAGVAGAAKLAEVGILVVGEEEEVGYVPRCSKCRHPLTRKRDDRITVGLRYFTLSCSKSGCGTENELDTYTFGLWLREAAKTAVVWQRGGLFPLPEAYLAPQPVVQGDAVLYEWNAAQVDGLEKDRFLRLTFDGRRVETHSPLSVFYETLLVPGRLKDFNGLPVRREWLDAVEGVERLVPDTDETLGRVSYTDLRLKGWSLVPASARGESRGFARVYKGASLRQEEDLRIGLFPDPARMPASWRWFRSFLDGERRRDYAVEFQGSAEILPWVRESVAGAPATIAVLSRQDQGLGVTYRLPGRDGKRATQEGSHDVEVSVGVDFGTTNSTIRYEPTLGTDDDLVRLYGQGLRPADAAGLIRWLTQGDQEVSSAVLGDWLPGPAYGRTRSDEYLYPSALWSFGQHALIRWSPEPPAPGARAHTGFKWDTSPGGDYDKRLAYLRELLFLGIAAVAVDLASDARPRVHIGYAFPLAFDERMRKDTGKLHQDLAGMLRTRAGTECHFYPVDECRAARKGPGDLNPSDVCLVADMGGGTLDLTLFTGAKDLPFQMGSIRYAGERYLSAFTTKRASTQEQREEFRWKLRDRISEGRCHESYGGDVEAEKLLPRFFGLALEYLRTMVAADRENVRAGEGGTDQGKPVKLLLVGNGWRLAGAFSAEAKTTGPESAFEAFYKEALRTMGEKRISAGDEMTGMGSDGQGLWKAIRNGKHLVVLGALAQAREKITDGLGVGAYSVQKTPSGRGFVVRTRNAEVRYRWHDLVGIGSGFKKVGLSLDGLRNADIDFLLDDAPEMTESWREFLESACFRSPNLNLPIPEDILRREFRKGIVGAAPPKIERGPFQVAIESGSQPWLES